MGYPVRVQIDTLIIKQKAMNILNQSRYSSLNFKGMLDGLTDLIVVEGGDSSLNSMS